MSDKPSWRKFEALFAGSVPQTMIDEPLDAPKAERASEIAKRRWFQSREEHERE